MVNQNPKRCMTVTIILISQQSVQFWFIQSYIVYGLLLSFKDLSCKQYCLLIWTANSIAKQIGDENKNQLII